MEVLKSIVYVSILEAGMSDEMIQDILKSSRKNNLAQGITGMLIYYNSSFFQVLEGPRDKVNQTFSRIKKDKRHSNIVVIDEDLIEEREFDEWEMGYRNISQENIQGEISLDDILNLSESGMSDVKNLIYRFYNANVGAKEQYSF